MKVVYSTNKSVLHRHLEIGTDIYEYNEGTLTLIGPEAEIKRVRGLRANQFSVVLDHERRIAQHEFHCDPAIIIDFNDESCLQVFLATEKEPGVVKRVALVMEDGTVSYVDTVIHISETRDFKSTLVKEHIGWAVHIESDQEITPVWQFARYGQQEELMANSFYGNSRILVPYVTSDRFGLCLTTSDPFGGVEHKHIFHGEVGCASGRWLYLGGQMYAPKLQEMPAYRSLVTLVDESEIPSRDAILGFDEVQIYCHPEDKEDVYNEFVDVAPFVSVFSVSRTQADNPDILCINPLLPVPEYLKQPYAQPFSFLLFEDQNNPHFMRMLTATYEQLKHLPADARCVERGWLNASEFNHKANARHYGIGFTYTTADQDTSAKALGYFTHQRAMTPCYGCDVANLCINGMAMPWAEHLRPTDNHCPIKKVLNGLQTID